MRVTVNIQRRVVYIDGNAHHMTRAGVMRLFVWLMDHASLQWGWDIGEYVFSVEVTP